MPPVTLLAAHPWRACPRRSLVKVELKITRATIPHDLNLYGLHAVPLPVKAQQIGNVRWLSVDGTYRIAILQSQGVVKTARNHAGNAKPPAGIGLPAPPVQFQPFEHPVTADDRAGRADGQQLYVRDNRVADRKRLGPGALYAYQGNTDFPPD